MKQKCRKSSTDEISVNFGRNSVKIHINLLDLQILFIIDQAKVKWDSSQGRGVEDTATVIISTSGGAIPWFKQFSAALQLPPPPLTSHTSAASPTAHSQIFHCAGLQKLGAWISSTAEISCDDVNIQQWKLLDYFHATHNFISLEWVRGAKQHRTTTTRCVSEY